MIRIILIVMIIIVVIILLMNKSQYFSMQKLGTVATTISAPITTVTTLNNHAVNAQTLALVRKPFSQINPQ